MKNKKIIQHEIDIDGNEIWLISTMLYYTDFTCYDFVSHKDRGPSVINSDGKEEWKTNGLLHREDGPALIETIGNEEWYKNSHPHREDGPAWIRVTGFEVWFKDSNYHRWGGPYIISSNGKEFGDPRDVMCLSNENGIYHQETNRNIIE